MRRLGLQLAALVVALTPGPNAQAAEGMFLLDQLPVAALQRSALKLPPQELQRLSRAVVQVAHSSTGSFISADGLVATNHHSAFACLARLNAQPEHNGIMEAGFYAPRRQDELSCPGYDLLVVVRMQEVTRQVLAGLGTPTSRTYRQWFEQVRLRREQLRASCEAGGQVVCDVAAMNGGTAYYLSSYRRIRDVRLVYAPPKALGKFGGDVDNWRFPRHTADFTFLRAYVGSDGAGAGFSAKNVPYRPDVHLALSPFGIARGSLVMVIGFPGRTSRHVTAPAARFYAEQQLPTTLDVVGGTLEVLHRQMAQNEEARRKYEGLEAGLGNASKYYQMSREGFARWNVVENKLGAERELIASLALSQARAAQQLLAEIAAVYKKVEGFYRRMAVLERMTGPSVPSMRTAFDIARWGVEKTKPDLQRKDERYKEKNSYLFLEAASRLEQESELSTERALLLFYLRRAEQVQSRSVRQLLAWVSRELARLRREAQRQHVPFATYYQQSIGVPLLAERHLTAAAMLSTAVDLLYAKTRLVGYGSEQAAQAARSYREQLFAQNATQLASVDDPLLALARWVEAELRELHEGPYALVEQYLGSALQPRWVSEFKRPPYPDANSTVRLSYGSVQDYTASATGKTYPYLTTLRELMRKDRGAYPFEVPLPLKQAYPLRLSSPYVDRHVQDIPVDFTATLDTTGGNSGSPVLDDKGRLVGLLFDGTPESILSDWQFLPSKQRSICLDLRFALYLAEVRGARALLEELGAPARGD